MPPQTPFVPFVVTLKAGEAYAIKSVERISVARELWTVVGKDGVIRVHSFQAIQQVAAGGAGDSYDA